MTSWPDHLPSGNQKRFRCDPVKRAARLGQRHGLIVKGKRISCPPQYGYRDHTNRARRLEHGFPLIRSLRAFSPTINISIVFIFR